MGRIFLEELQALLEGDITESRKVYTLDGEEVDIDEYIADNTAPGVYPKMTKREIRQIHSMRRGQEMVFGGGAAAEFVLRRVK